MTTPRSLAGVTVAVTRPAAQAGRLCHLIEARGGTAIAFPAVEILAAAPQPQLASLPQRLERFDMAIFVSANAVEGAARLLGDTLPAGLRLAAVGDATQRAIERRWQRPVLSPATGWNSEALLATGELQKINGRHIIIFRGQGGRELLAQTLNERGASVEYAEVYRRARPAGDLAPLLRRSTAPDLITATSNAILQNLYDMAADSEQRDWLLQRQLVAISERAVELAARLGFRHAPLLAGGSGDQALLEAISAWHAERRHTP